MHQKQHALLTYFVFSPIIHLRNGAGVGYCPSLLWFVSIDQPVNADFNALKSLWVSLFLCFDSEHSFEFQFYILSHTHSSSLQEQSLLGF